MQSCVLHIFDSGYVVRVSGMKWYLISILSIHNQEWSFILQAVDNNKTYLNLKTDCNLRFVQIWKKTLNERPVNYKKSWTVFWQRSTRSKFDLSEKFPRNWNCESPTPTCVLCSSTKKSNFKLILIYHWFILTSFTVFECR